MADTTYSVEVAYLTKGNLLGGLDGATRKVGDLHRGIGGLEKPLSKVGDAFASSLGSAVDGVTSTLVGGLTTAATVAGGALAAGLAKGLQEGMSFAAFQEQAKIGIASVRSMLGDVPFDTAMGGATESVERLRKAAAVLPGEFKDVLGSFQSILPAATTAGIEMTRVEGLAARAVAAAAAVGVNQSVAGHELAAYIEGRATSRMPLITRLGLHPTQDKKLTEEQRFAKVESMFGKLGPAIQAYSKSWEGLTSSARDNARQVAKTFADPLFNSVKVQLGRALDWFGGNEVVVTSWATNLGRRVADAFDWSVRKIEEWYGPITTFAATLRAGVLGVWRDVEPFVERIAEKAKAFMLDPEAFEKMKTAGLALGGLKLGSKLLDFAPAVGGLAELTPALIAAAGAATTLYGAHKALTDASSPLHDAAVGSRDRSLVELQKLDQHWSRAAPHLASASDKIGTAFDRVAETMGTGALMWGENAIRSLNYFGDALSSVTAKIQLISDLFPKPPPMAEDPAFDTRGRPAFEVGASSLAAAALSERPPGAIPKHVTHFHGARFEIKVEGSDDPTRVAQKVADVLERRWSSPSAARSNPNAMFTR